MDVDPIKYAIFSHRLYNILEEGRINIGLVTGSAVVKEGGETLCSLYSTDGTPILTAAGILLHVTGARDFVRKAIEWYEDDPGILEGDQLFFNDPYIGGQHIPDQIIIKPIFYGGKRIAWCSSFMHTPEVGAIEPAGMSPVARETWHEGLAVQGLKIVEQGHFRPDVFNTICRHSRDPHLIGLDTKAKIAANNVCAKRVLELVGRYGLDFVNKACERLIQDSEKLARAKLAKLPDGVWKSRLYGDTDGLVEKPFKVQCMMTKYGDEITFDFTGSSPQNDGAINCTLAGTWGSLFVPLASQLFWDISWNGGMIAPVHLVAPEGTVVNCKFPAACGNGVHSVGGLVTATAHECIARMLFVGGMLEDVNSSWRGAVGGVIHFGGVTQHGNMTAGSLLESFAAGLGATPERDGVDTGANMMNPTSSISDVEVLEASLPLLYFSKKEAIDTGGFGKHLGGRGPESIFMLYGTPEFKVGIRGCARRTPGNWGMYGGYPSAVQEGMFINNSNVREWFADGKIPTTIESLMELEGDKLILPSSAPMSTLREYDVVYACIGGGGGYGDPLDRDPKMVKLDIEKDKISQTTARNVYGVIRDSLTGEVEYEATRMARNEIRSSRRNSS